MKTVPLTRGYTALVDDDDFLKVSQIKWHVRHNGTYGWYAANNSGKGGMSKDIYMHRFIVRAKHGQIVDHRDGNGLNNQRSNLRLCWGATINGLNKKHSSNNTSGFIGASWHNGMKKWRARVRIKRKEKIIGWYDSVKEAGLAYRKYVDQLLAAYDQ